MKVRVVFDVDVPLYSEEPDEDPEYTAQLAAEFGPEPEPQPDDIARVLSMMLGARNGDAFQSAAMEEALFTHIRSVIVVSAERAPEPPAIAQDL